MTTAMADDGAGDDDADLIRTITGDEDETPAAPAAPPRREGFKHKLFRYLGYIFWPPFLRGDLGAVNPRMLLGAWPRSEAHTSELQSLMRISYADFCFKTKK